ncbi:MAG TPA: lycopene cyclase domain-containing protein [Bacteroidales bacterium]|nr:lycopene cyclase domain-containing protein [Bacteroidales bacterium]
MSLYLTLELCSLSIPLILSFDKRVAFFRHWKALFPSLFITGIIFITADIIFTKNDVWGFNSLYHSDILIAGIPLEEWLFFIIIPYASIFTHYVIINYFPGTCLSDKSRRIITMVLIAALMVLIILFHNRTYTAFYSGFMIILLLISFFDKSRLLNRFYITFLVILVPFFIVNGILTGSFIEGEVVWYNESEITGFRIFTVPFEDIMYGFSLIFMNLMLMDKFKKPAETRLSVTNEKN